MKLKTIKTDAEAREAIHQYPDERPVVELTTRNGTVVGVRVGSLHVTSTYGLEVAREVQHEEETRYRMTASIKGFEPRVEYFDDYGKALELKRSFDDNAEVTLDENVKVLVDGSGKIIGEVGQQTASGDDLPF